MNSCFEHHKKIFGFQELDHFTHGEPLKGSAELELLSQQYDFVLELGRHDLIDVYSLQRLWLHTTSGASLARQLEE
jgi:hypothetical protein